MRTKKKVKHILRHKPDAGLNAIFLGFLCCLFAAVVILVFKSQQINAQLAPQTKALRVMELRYFPKGETDVIYHPKILSAQLQDRLKTGSIFHGYLGNKTPSIEVQVISIINRYKPRPNINNDWVQTYKAMLAEDNLCQKIHDDKIDQIWLWVDPRIGYDPNPGVEYVISSSMFQKNVLYATSVSPAFCNGQDSFVIMGFDDTRTVAEAEHSFGHFMEGLLGNLQTVTLFWYQYGGNTSAGYPLPERCGSVHFPPNSASNYDYTNRTYVNTTCENWKPDGTGAKTSINCLRWGCTADGYFQWWFQNMPNANNTLMYQGKKLPNWWDFITDMDYSIPYYYKNTAYFMNRTFLDMNTMPNKTQRVYPTPVVTNTPNPTPTGTVSLPRCTGQCKGDPIGSTYPAGYSCIGMDNLCYVCGTNKSFTVNKSGCAPSPTPTSTPSPTPTLVPNVPSKTPTPTYANSSNSCGGQCKGDPPNSVYPIGRTCFGMDNQCYVCTTKNFVVSQTACGPTATPSPTSTLVPTLLPTSTPVITCVGQCKGDMGGTSYPAGKVCIGMDNLCYVCGTNRNFSVSTTACSGQ